MKAAAPLHQPVHRLLAALAVHPGHQILFVPKMIIKGLQGQAALFYDLFDCDAFEVLAARKRQKRVTERLLGCAFFHRASPFTLHLNMSKSRFIISIQGIICKHELA